mmetsp:Transcript_12910/g.23763  ORF Transcript_12910/g.23763 Transcript_12910/m.23763 type:complete len:1288 (-) Transcript_12910:276-4139(-)
MFRRNKNKGAKALGDDMVALTGPGALSSSSGATEGTNKSKGGRFLGRRKKKIDTGKGKSSNNVTTATAKPILSNAEREPVASAATNINVNIIARNPQMQPQLQPQPQHAPESAPQAMKKRPPSKNVIVTTRSAAEERYLQPQRSQQQKRQQKQPQQPRPTTIPEMRDSSNIQRQSSPQNNSLLASDARQGSRSNGNGRSGILSNVQIVAAAATAAASKPPPLVSNSGGNSVNSAVPMARSGWSVVSSASSAMNSEHYIQSLESLPTPTVRSGKAFPMLSTQPDDRISALSNGKIRSALSRQFGRNYPPQTFCQKWFVNVSQPEWYDDEGRHKYKIKITMNPSAPNDDNGSSFAGSSFARSAVTESYSHLAFASTTASRSLQDFVWLEQALRAEYHGALVVPILSFALYFGAMSENVATVDDESLASRSIATDATSKGLTVNSLLGENGGNAITNSYRFLEEKMERNEIVDESLLANWLSDIINGIRGNGEVILYNSVDVVESEAMETFLYRHSETPDGFGSSRMGADKSTLGSPFNLFSAKNRCLDKSLLENLVENPFECFGLDTVCGGDSKKKMQEKHRKMPLSMMCSSGTTGIPGIEYCNSNFSQSEAEVDFSSRYSSIQASSQGFASHSELLEAERDIIASYLKSSSLAISKVQSLTKDEAYVGQCWKRFAISLSNLFAVEKDLEQAHIGDQIKSNKKNQPFRKLRKSAVDDTLRILARAKIDRSNPSLRTLRTMLNAYFADLNSVVPAFREYSEAINQLHQLDEVHSIKSNRRKIPSNQPTGNNEWYSSLEQLRAMTWGVTKHITGEGTVVTSESDPTVDDELSTVGSFSTTQTKAFQSRVFSNEKTLKFSVTLLCKASPLRNARMAWWYLKIEAKQALKVHTAATTLRQKLSIDADAAIAMKERRYDADETKDNEAELKLVKRILDIGSSEDSGNMFDNEASRQNAIRIATEQVGRWNAKTALALMEAAGVADAEVQIDETSRELRHVRKYAISLRENVARCLESAEALASSFILNSEGTVQISRSRREFWAAISVVFSGKIISEETGSHVSNIRTPSTRVLSSAGIDVTDRGGWLGHNPSFNRPNQHRRNCGEAARQYLKKRDNQANILISRIVKLLKDYERRLEGIESFVYMHCVGIQLEKHCSRTRSKALSAWEKRTDISTAINVATKKKIPKLVQELKVKLDALPQVSHTTVLKRKEEHLTSKTLKSDLHKLANRRFGRAQEVSTERVIAVMSLWAKHEESVAMEEVKALSEVVQEVELSIQGADVDAALDSYSLANR